MRDLSPASKRSWALRVAETVAHSPRRLAALCLMFFGALSLGGLGLSVNFSFQAFTSNKAQAALEAQQQRLLDVNGPAANAPMLFVLVNTADQTSLLTPKRIESLVALETALKKVDGVDAIHSILDAPATARGLMDDGPRVRDVDDEDDAKVLPAALKKAPFAIPLFIDAQHHSTAFNIRLDAEEGADAGAVYMAVTTDVLAAVDQVAHAPTWDKALVVHSGGVPVVRAALVERMINEQVLFTLLALLICALTLWFFFRSGREMLVALCCAGLPVGATFGLMGALGIPIDALTQVISTLLPVIAVADAIHLLCAIRDEEAAQGPGIEAVIEGTRRVLPACLLTSVTTAAGFLSLTITGIDALVTFGWLCAVGLLLAFASLAVMVPAACVLWPRAAQTEDTLRASPKLPVKTALVVTAAALLLCSGIPRLVLDSSRDGLLGYDTPAAQAGALLDEHLAGTLRLSVLIDADLSSPKVVAHLLDFEREMQARADVKSVIGAAGLWERMALELTAAAPTPGDIRTDRPLLAQVQLLAKNDARAAQLFWGALRAGENDLTRVLIAAPDAGATATLALRDAIDESLLRHHLTGTVSSLQLATYEGVMSITYELMRGLLLLVAFLGVLFLLVFRSVRICLIALICNVIPLAAALGALGWLAPELNPVSAVVLTVALGLSVDDTIHVLHALADPDVPSLPGSTRRALLTTSAMLVLAFMVVAASDFPINRTFGLIGASAAALAYGIDISLLLVLIRHQSWTDRVTGRADASTPDQAR